MTECNICYETSDDVVRLKCCNETKHICFSCVNCLTSPICPYCRKEIDESCLPYMNEASKVPSSAPVSISAPVYTFDDFIHDERIINPYLYEDSRRLRRQMRRLRQEYRERTSSDRTPRERTNRQTVQNYTRRVRDAYNNGEELQFLLDIEED